MRYLRDKRVSVRVKRLFFFLYIFWWPGWELLRYLSHSGACKWDPGKTSKSQKRVRTLTKEALLISVLVTSQERKVKFHNVPSFQIHTLWVWLGGIFIIYWSFPTKNSSCFLVCLALCVLWTWFNFPHVWACRLAILVCIGSLTTKLGPPRI